MGRLGTPEVAAVAVLLASDESAFTSGIAYFVDGECDSGTPSQDPTHPASFGGGEVI